MDEVGVNRAVVLARSVPGGEVVVDLCSIGRLWEDGRAVEFGVPEGSEGRVAGEGDLPVAV